MKKVRLGIIGIGQQGGFYTYLLTGVKVNPGGGDDLTGLEIDGMEVGAFCDIDPKKVERLKELFPNIPVFSDYIEMMDSGLVDAVITTVPHYLHPVIGIEALKRDLHVLLEKPAGVYTKQVKEVIEASKAKPNLTFAVFFNQRMNPLYQRLKEIIDSGALGAIRRTNWIITSWYRPQAYYNMSSWRATWKEEGGGVLVNQAPHQIDLIQWLCGMPKKVYSKCGYGFKRDIEVEDEVTALFTYENGATGALITCTHDLLGTDRLEIHGDNGKIVVDNSSVATVKILKKPEQQIDAEIKDLQAVFKLMGGASSEGSELYDEEVVEFPNAWGKQHADILRNFAANILHKTPLIAPGSDGINGVRLANAIHLSSWLGEEVDIDFNEDFFLEKLNEKIGG